jgi:hypothetical protein
MLIPCGGCRRHVRSSEPACPFCGRAIEPAPARSSVVGRLSRAAVFAGLAGCGAPSTPATQVDRTKQVDQTKQVEDTYAAKPAAGMGTLRGSVRDHRGTFIPNFTVTLGNDPPRTAITDAQGFFTFEDLPAGSYELSWPISGSRQGSDSRVVEVKVDAVIRADIQFWPPPSYDPNSPAMPYGAPPARRRIV